MAKTVITSLRVPKDVKIFLASLDNANSFILDLVRDTNEYKIFQKAYEASPKMRSLFEHLETVETVENEA